MKNWQAIDILFCPFEKKIWGTVLLIGVFRDIENENQYSKNHAGFWNSKILT